MSPADDHAVVEMPVRVDGQLLGILPAGDDFSFDLSACVGVLREPAEACVGAEIASPRQPSRSDVDKRSDADGMEIADGPLGPERGAQHRGHHLRLALSIEAAQDAHRGKGPGSDRDQVRMRRQPRLYDQ